MGARDGEGMPDVVEPGHIEVVLDFVPVSERLPEKPGGYMVLRPHKCYRMCRDTYDPSLREGIWCSGVDNTHWAEIPTIG